jgi:hypothetical protein
MPKPMKKFDFSDVETREELVEELDDLALRMRHGGFKAAVQIDDDYWLFNTEDQLGAFLWGLEFNQR